MADLARAYYRKVIAGILQAPPAMVDQVFAWAVGILAATDMAKLEHDLDLARITDRSQESRMQEVEAAVDAWEAAPTSWKAYKAYNDAMWNFGSPGERWNAKDFQKLTPERREALEERARRSIAGAREQVARRRRLPSDVERVETEMQRVKGLVQPGAVPMTGDSIEKVFPIDTAGWRYWSADLQRQFEERVRTEGQALLDRLDEAMAEAKLPPEMYEMMAKTLRKQVENPQAAWDSIKVKMIRKGTNFAGHWQEGTRTLTLVAPYGTYQHLLDDLQDTIRHELQHFAQSYLAFMIDATFKAKKPGFPAELLRTREFRQDMGRHHPSFNPQSPEAKQVYQKLKSQGIDPRGVDFHSLDDIEFYTKLADAVSKFKRAVQRAPKGDIKMAIRLYTGATPMPSTHDRNWHEKLVALGGYDFTKWFEPDRFFLALLKQAKPKWKKAVAEFVKAVT